MVSIAAGLSLHAEVDIGKNAERRLVPIVAEMTRLRQENDTDETNG
jgi:hypothetical protein